MLKHLVSQSLIPGNPVDKFLFSAPNLVFKQLLPCLLDPPIVCQLILFLELFFQSLLLLLGLRLTDQELDLEQLLVEFVGLQLVADPSVVL
jgi:hypothetical protein